jgi:histidinol phosphatase-like enzyme
MSRYKTLLNSNDNGSTPKKIVGIFPFNCLVNADSTDVTNGRLDFLESALKALQDLGKKKYSVVLFINQFKNTPLSYEHFSALNQAMENFVRSQGVEVAGLYWCPSLDPTDIYVTPNPGMFQRVTENQSITWKDVPVISSNSNDLKAAEKVKAIPIRIGNGPNKWTRFDSLN